MNIRPHRIIIRRKTKVIKVGNVAVGGDSQISVQSMTNTLTTDIKNTINQINDLDEAGATATSNSHQSPRSYRGLHRCIHKCAHAH